MKSILFFRKFPFFVDIGLEREERGRYSAETPGVLLPFLFAPFKQRGERYILRLFWPVCTHAEDGNFFKSQTFPVISTLGHNTEAIAASQLVKLNFDARHSPPVHDKRG